MNYDQDEKILNLQLAHVNASLKEIQYFLNTPSAKLTSAQRNEAINEQNRLIKEQSSLQENLDEYYKIAILINNAKDTYDTYTTISANHLKYPPKYCHMKWKNKAVNKNY